MPGCLGRGHTSGDGIRGRRGLRGRGANPGTQGDRYHRASCGSKSGAPQQPPNHRAAHGRGGGPGLPAGVGRAGRMLPQGWRRDTSGTSLTRAPQVC